MADVYALERLSRIGRIRSLGDAGMSQHELGRRFGIAQSTAGDIVKRRAWRSVPEIAA